MFHTGFTMSASLLRAALLCQLLVVTTRGYMMYQDRIPNGETIPHPCFIRETWPGVGHKNPHGGGSRNPFGDDFAANNNRWTPSLCRRDSDGDGRTNGEELGDPNCVWTPGNPPNFTKGISHPGVCEPFGTKGCRAKNNWQICKDAAFNCSQIETPDVSNISLAMPNHEVPSVATSYFCMVFDMPQDRDYHIVAALPILDNHNVIHHMFVYGCDNDPTDRLSRYNEPGACSMESDTTCRHTIAGWGVGNDGWCAEHDGGFRFGRTAFKRMLLQIHWNNPERRADFTDSSGMVLYYTPKLRKHDLGVLTTGPMHLYMPPGISRLEQVGVCPSSCTKHLPTLNIVTLVLHMHDLGRAARLDQYRNGVKIANIISENSYSYDFQKFYSFDQPVKVLPGDELRVTCEYDTTSRTRTVYYGEGTKDEMCFAFIGYYPWTEFTSCNAFGNGTLCTSSVVMSSQFGDCNVDPSDTSLLLRLGQLGQKCDPTGQVCYGACKMFLQSGPHPCLKGDARHLMEYMLPKLLGKEEGTALTRMLRSCDSELLTPRRIDGRPNMTVKNTPTIYGVVISLIGAYLFSSR